MARPLRIQYPGAVYHVMNRGGARQRTYLIPQDYRTFLQVLESENISTKDLTPCLLKKQVSTAERIVAGDIQATFRCLAARSRSKVA